MAKRQVVLLVWFAAQVLVVFSLLWLSAIKGVQDHHLGMLLVPTFGVLLFPGVQGVMALLGLAFWVASAFGVEAAMLPNSHWVEIPAGVLVWGASAWATYKFWSWVISRCSTIRRNRSDARGRIA